MDGASPPKRPPLQSVTSSRDRKRGGGGYAVVRVITVHNSDPMGVFQDIPKIQYLRAAHRDQGDDLWTAVPDAAWRYWSEEDAVAMALVMDRGEGYPCPQVVPWSKRRDVRWMRT